MNPSREIAQIEATLGCSFTTRAFGPYMAWQSPLRRGTQSDELRESARLATEIERHVLQWHAMGYTVFLGYTDVEGHMVFAIPRADPIQLMDLFEVGTYNDFRGDTANLAKQYMASLFETDPFVPYLVDAANFRVRFINPVSLARASDIAHAIADFDPDAYEFAMASAAPDSDPQGDDPIELLQQFIVREQKLLLWWD